MAQYTMVDKETCIARGTCGSAAPDIFGYDEEGLAENIMEDDHNRGVVEVPGALHDDLDDACAKCPTASIVVSTAPFE